MMLCAPTHFANTHLLIYLSSCRYGYSVALSCTTVVGSNLVSYLVNPSVDAHSWLLSDTLYIVPPMSWDIEKITGFQYHLNDKVSHTTSSLTANHPTVMHRKRHEFQAFVPLTNIYCILATV